jgi:hypothetical protein
MENKLPTFIGIGAPRCGTTWLYENLKGHDNVLVSEIKELCYFMPKSYRSNAPKGIEWYKKHFNVDKKHLAWGEISPRYYFTEGTAQMIKDTIPNIKLILLLRNPAEMVQSLAYFHANMYPDRLDPSGYGLHDYLDHHFVEDICLFHKHYLKFLEFFDESQILTVFYDDIKSSSSTELSKVAKFLNIPDTFDSAKSKKVINKGLFPRSFTIANLISNYQGVFKYRIKAAEKKLNRISLTSSKDISNFKYSRTQFEDLIKVYEDDTKLLETRFNRDLSHWLSFDQLPKNMKNE